jgi:hypothetical protein
VNGRACGGKQVGELFLFFIDAFCIKKGGLVDFGKLTTSRKHTPEKAGGLPGFPQKTRHSNRVV